MTVNSVNLNKRIWYLFWILPTGIIRLIVDF